MPFVFGASRTMMITSERCPVWTAGLPFCCCELLVVSDKGPRVRADEEDVYRRPVGCLRGQVLDGTRGILIEPVAQVEPGGAAEDEGDHNEDRDADESPARPAAAASLHRLERGGGGRAVAGRVRFDGGHAGGGYRGAGACMGQAVPAPCRMAFQHGVGFHGSGSDWASR